MKFANTFTVPVAPAEAWPLLLDVPTIAPCVPGAEITEALGERKFRGRALVKVGPVQLAFEGEAEIVDVDDAAMTARVIAKGADRKGRGSASATVDFAVAADAAGARVNVATDLNLVGAVAQYGRGAGLLKLIADELIGQFARNLEAAIGGAPGEQGASPATQGRPISGVAVVGSAIRTAIQRKLKRE